MTRLTFATGAITGAAVIAALVLPRLDPPADVKHQPREQPVCAEIRCRSVPTPASMKLERSLERQGFTCTGKARLSESVIVDLEAGARLLPFDAAMKIGAEGSGWMRSYCSQP